MTQPSSTSEVEADIRKFLNKFLDDNDGLWEQLMEGDDPDPQLYDELVDKALADAAQAINQLLDTARNEGRAAELEYLSWHESEPSDNVDFGGKPVVTITRIEARLKELAGVGAATTHPKESTSVKGEDNAKR